MTTSHRPFAIDFESQALLLEVEDMHVMSVRATYLQSARMIRFCCAKEMNDHGGHLREVFQG